MAAITQLAGNLTRIDLVPAGLTGFDHFIVSYVYQAKNTFLIDIGPAATAPDLLCTLKEIGVEHVDYILLTHIHLDHAGAAGQLSRAFPEAKIICHPMGVKHLHQPQKLWQGSLNVLRDFAVAYQEPMPVPLERLVSADDFSLPGVMVYQTPGHAPHHLSFAFDDCLFLGEAAGIFFNLEDGYQRPATPPRFEMEKALQSLELLEQLEPKLTAFAHYGVSANGLAQIKTARDQLQLWTATVKAIILDHKGSMSACITELLATDPNLVHFGLFNEAEQKRELEFFENALRGMLGWLQTAAHS